MKNDADEAGSQAARDCRVMLERLSAYLERDLPSAECRRIERHASTCPRCERVIQQLRRTTGLCQRAGMSPLPAPVRRRALERVRRLIAETDER